MDSAIDSWAGALCPRDKCFEVNHADGALPLDKWLSLWHDSRAAAQVHRPVAEVLIPGRVAFNLIQTERNPRQADRWECFASLSIR